MQGARDLREVGVRVEVLIRELGSLADSRAREKAEELVRLLMEFYGAGLDRILQIARADGAAAARLFDRLAEDELVASLLILHGLHPLDTETRVIQALDRVRPYLGSHGGDIKLLGLEDGIVRLRLEGSCHGCPSSTVTMRLAIERAIEEAAPEVARIEVEGSVQPAPGLVSQRAEQELRENGRPAGEWIALPSLSRITSGEIAGIDVFSGRIIVCKLGESFFSYHSACPSCSAALENGSLRGEILSCAGCGHDYNVRRAGQCETAGGLHLEPLPLLVERDTVKIAVPAAHPGVHGG
jgi:Fe-S cluster biogenesis protein NfuA/nitrite reductase/ring-hydroxylating ferredoxin subunit